MSRPDPSPSLVQLFDRHRDGHPAAVNDILAHCQDRLVRLTRQTLRQYPSVRQWGDTADVYGQASFRLIRALRELTFDTPRDFLCLAALHIRNTLIDLTRRAKVVGWGRGDPGSRPDPLGEKAADSTNAPEKLAMWTDIHEAIAAAPADERELFDLLYYQGLRQAEAAEVLGVPLSTLKTRWQAARVNLMRRLKNEPPV